MGSRLQLRRAKPARDITGAIRWVLVRADGSPAWGRFHYPSEGAAQGCAAPGERPVRVRVTARAGPFSDHVERLD